MLYHWLNKQNNSRLIVFFAGWSFDFYPFEFLKYNHSDVLFVYDYNSLDRETFNALKAALENNTYAEKILITWSMGVFAAYSGRKYFENFDKKIAVNGTAYPVHDEFGIPQKPFLLTLRHAKTGLEGKFYQNIFDSNEEFEKYTLSPVRRTVENRENELKSLYSKIKEENSGYEKFYDFALISKFDRIIPTKNQINFWQNNAPFKLLESGHFPFYNFKDWEELAKL